MTDRESPPSHPGRSAGYFYDRTQAALGFHEFWRKLWRHRLLLLMILSISATTAVYATFMARSTYLASTLLEIEKDDKTFIN
jgi:uncharacterized protein involved in exopolysaccharide biosynthesis